MIRTICICIALSMICAPLTAIADQMTVADLQQICSGKDIESQSACRFFILGVVEGASLGTELKTVGGPLCIAPGVSSSALVASVKKMMQAVLIAYPEDKSLPAAGFVAAAAMKSYPCEKAK